MSKRILVVDDDSQVLKYLVETLASVGYDTIAFEHFEEARLHLAAGRPDLLLTDVRLGAFNGLQLALYAREKYKDVPVIVLTGYEDPTLRSEAVKWGAEFIVKPVRREELLQRVAFALGGGKGTQPKQDESEG
jgi:DNA-binding response OmpR family regulator